MKKSKPVGYTRTLYSHTGKNMKWAETFVWCLLLIFKIVYWDHLTQLLSFARDFVAKGQRLVWGQVGKMCMGSFTEKWCHGIIEWHYGGIHLRFPAAATSPTHPPPFKTRLFLCIWKLIYFKAMAFVAMPSQWLSFHTRGVTWLWSVLKNISMHEPGWVGVSSVQLALVLL